MITTDGKVHIKRYLAGFVPSIAKSIAFGVGTAAEATSDFKLQFEAGRVDITLTSYDFVNNKLIYKAQLPDDFDGQIMEAALFTAPANDVAGQYGSKLLTTFDSVTEDWADPGTLVAGTYTSGTFSRISSNSLTHTPAASATKTDALTSVLLDLSGYSGADKFVFAFNVGNAFTSQVVFRFLTDASNYYTIALGAQTAGYKIVEVNKSTAVATGTPNWANITALTVVTTSSGGGASQVQYDGIRIEDVDTVNPNYLLIAREVLASSFVKEAGKIQEVEFSLDINIT